MTTNFLEVDHHVRKVFIFAFLTFSLMGDWPVLAEDAAEITIGKKDGARSVFAHQRYLFAKMGLSAENHGSVWASTEPYLPPLTIYPAAPRTELAILEESIGLLDPPSQFTLMFQSFISWVPSLYLLLSGIKGDRIQEKRAAQNKRAFYKIPT